MQRKTLLFIFITLSFCLFYSCYAGNNYLSTDKDGFAKIGEKTFHFNLSTLRYGTVFNIDYFVSQDKPTTKESLLHVNKPNFKFIEPVEVYLEVRNSKTLLHQYPLNSKFHRNNSYRALSFVHSQNVNEKLFLVFMFWVNTSTYYVQFPIDSIFEN